VRTDHRSMTTVLMPDDSFLLTPENARGYLLEEGFMRADEEIRITPLGGGVSNVVLLVEWREAGGRRWVMKQSLEKLRVKDDWRSDRSRIFREALSLRRLRPALGASALPEVIHTDFKRFLYIMTAAPAGSQVWKDLLLARRADSQVARNAGLLLARMISASRDDELLNSDFWDRTVFDQLRIDPYYRTTAARHPELRRQFDDLIATTLEIRTSVVHGDYSPKNMLVRGENIFLIDFEVVHWGDPAFDAAFLMNHLILKAFHQPVASPQYLSLVFDFWNSLEAAVRPEAAPGLEGMTLRHLGGLMLARIDGKSPVEYITDLTTKEKVRRAATQILVQGPHSLPDALEIVRREIGA
jgi:5-methylthioribose kinase